MNIYDRVIVKRLRELAEGAPPLVGLNGICYDIHRTLREAELGGDGYEYCADVFERLGLNRDQPLPDDYGSPWEGDAGKRRRALCKQMADHHIEGVWP